MSAERNSQAKVKVLGIGDFGCRFVDYFARGGYRNLELLAIDTDVQTLLQIQAHGRILIGDQLMHGRGASGDHQLGRKAVGESENELRQSIKGADLVFLVAGLGGGTGTGALAPIAEIAKDAGALTIGVVTLPFSFEGRTRVELANKRLPEINQHIHSLVATYNDVVLAKAGNALALDQSFDFFADTLFRNTVGIFRLINVAGIINLDLSDIATLLSDGSSALMSYGQASSEENAELAAKDAMENALGLINLSEATNVLVSVTGSSKMSLFEVNQAVSTIRSNCSPHVNLVFGGITRPARENLEVTIFATVTKENVALSEAAVKILPELNDLMTSSANAPAMPKLKVFLCHSSADKPAVRKLYQQLYSRTGIDPWLDEAKLLPGVRWDSEIKKAVNDSEVVIVCISKSSINKEGYVQKEIKRALDIADEKPEGTIFIIPLKLEDCDVPERIRQWQWVNYYENDAFERLMASLRIRAKSIGIDVE